MTAPAPESNRPDLPVPPAPPARQEQPVLPDRARDDLDVGWGESGSQSRDDDERFLRERPPHWE